MKRILFALIIMLPFASCAKLDELKENPNNVSETHPQLLLTNIEWNTFQVAGSSPMFAGRMLVQTDGEQTEQFYTWTRGSFDSYNRLRDVSKMQEEAERIDNNAYIALGKFFRAYYFYNLAITFGDVPYSQALKGESQEIYTPEYDTQQAIFEGILTELKEADELLKEQIIEGDIIFDGSAAQWKKAINSFRLKVLISLSNKSEEINAAAQFAAIYENKELIGSVEQSGMLQFADQLGNRYTEFNSSSYGSARYMDSTFVQRLISREDPRLFIYADQTPNAKKAGLSINDFAAYEGGNPIAAYSTVNDKAATGAVSKVNLRYTVNPTAEPHMFLGYPELQFILAEAAARGWIADDAQNFYENGVKASFAFYETYATTYAAYVSETSAETYLAGTLVDFSKAANAEEQIELIITQKYLQSFLQGGWTLYFDHLRTGYPTFLMLPGVSAPVRWVYPQSEYDLNETNVETAIARQFGNGNDNTRETTWWLK